ncbi:MAG TPA: response regulator [Chloroflexota bacterium]|jgi:two-component system cell cycle response regulator DivK
MSGELILIVEDNPRNLKLVRDLLRLHGFKTIEAATGAQAIALAQDQEPRLVLLDIQLPDLDGASVLAALRSHDRTAGLAVVALTAFAMHGDRERFLAAGFDGYLAKPISVKTFAGEIGALCAQLGSKGLT